MKDDQEKILTKRFQTTMIGSIYEFEKAFGYLWGHTKDENEDLTSTEEKFLDLWEDTRNKILNNGNNQLRKAVSELNKLKGSVKYNYKFYKERGYNE